MNDTPRRLFWDSCVVCRHLTEIPPELLDDISQFIAEAQKGDCEIYFSTIMFAEVLPSKLKGKGYGSFNDLLDDLQGALRPVAPNVQILANAALLRDRQYRKKEMAKGQKPRVMSVPDAIHLASCVFIRDVMGISDVEFHTFDEGKHNGPDGKCVPLLGFNHWSDHLATDPMVAAVRALKIAQPMHSQPRFEGMPHIKR